MLHDPAYLLDEKKIAETLKSGATELSIKYPFIGFLSIENKGGNYAS